MTIQQMGDGGEGVQFPNTKVGFYGVTPISRGAAVTTLATTPTATDIATAVNAIISRLQLVGIIS